MYNTLLRKGTTGAFIVGFIASLILVYAVISGSSGLDVEQHELLRQRPQFDIAIQLGNIFVILGLIAIFIGGIYGLVTNPKSSIKFVIGIVAIVVVLFILYSIFPEETTGPLVRLNEQYDLQGAKTRLISGGIAISLLLMALAFVAVILAELRNAFK